MARRLPPLNGLKAFEAAARSESVTRAAEELNVTQGAISHQVKSLEDTLGFKLFHRERQRVTLTEVGRDYLIIIRDALDQIAVGTERLLQRRESGVLTVSTSPDFAAKWLVNRLGGFAETHPNVDLRVSATTHYVDFARDDVDIAIRHGNGNWPGLDCLAVRRAGTGHRSPLHDDATPCIPLRGSYGNCRSALTEDESSGEGRMTWNKLPSVSPLASSMRPPFASTAQRAIASPSPTPPSSLDRPGSTR
jgi:DNA-binding transcriptional LysR family regulator